MKLRHITKFGPKTPRQGGFDSDRHKCILNLSFNLLIQAIMILKKLFTSIFYSIHASDLSRRTFSGGLTSSLRLKNNSS